MFIVRRQSRTFSYGEWTTALIGGACGGGARHWSLGRRLDPPPVPHLNQWRRHCNQQRHSSNLTCVWELARFGFEYCFNIQSICNMESIEYEIWNWLVLFWIRVVEFYMHPHPVSWWELKGFLGFLGNFLVFLKGKELRFLLSLKAAEIGSTGSGWIHLTFGMDPFWIDFIHIWIHLTSLDFLFYSMWIKINMETRDSEVAVTKIKAAFRNARAESGFFWFFGYSLYDGFVKLQMFLKR